MEKAPFPLKRRSSDLESFNSTRSNIPRSSSAMRRAITRAFTRKVAAIALFFFFVGFVTYNKTADVPAAPTIGSLCPSNRTNPHRIPVPAAQEVEFLSGLWTELHDIFRSNIPSPPHLNQPKHTGFPNQDKLGSFFSLTDKDADATRETHEAVLNQLPEYPEGRFQGRGVVVLAGGRYSEFAATSVGMLREVGSRLPVEIWSKDKSEEYDGWCDEVQSEGMVCRRLADYMDLDSLKNPYQWKVFTLLFSTFSDIIFLDADDMPIKNPDFIFDSEVYKENGVLLWPDYWKHTGTPWLPYLVGLTDEKSSSMLVSEKSVESGQIVWNKRTNWKSLVLATYYNFHGPAFFYTIFNNGWAGWGDKDTFPVALKATNEKYFQVPFDIVTVFAQGSDPILGIAMVQANPANATGHEPLFMHSNIVKWSMRDFLCEGCEEIPGHGKHRSHLENHDSPVYPHLMKGKRIFATQQLFDKNVDPEPVMWKAIEFTACRSVWGNEMLCHNARDHMERTFGFTFTPIEVPRKGGGVDSTICVGGPGPRKPT